MSALSTSMLETYDSQMQDYQSDLDVQMHPSSSDQWFQDENVMEDDGLHLHLHKPQHENNGISIEVDMEPYEDDATEYEMMDDPLHQDADVAELLDVEVYDASIQETKTLALSGEDFAEEISTKEIAAGDPQENLPIVIPAEANVIIPPENPSDQVHNESGPTQTPEITRDEGIIELEPISSDGQAPKEAVFESNAQDGGPNESAIEHIYSRFHDGGGDEPDPENFAVGGDVLETTVYEHTPEHQAEEPSNDANPEDRQKITHGEENSSTFSTGDPHEISEGVYIDPPPPVLLTLGLEEPISVSLFNQETLPEALDIPTPQDQNEAKSPFVLLQHLPTLYYEPLSSVFEALRADEYIMFNLNIAEAELSVEAYDLQLSISEDNIYAREVSIHDLNVIHDGSNISGPLRLRLYTSVPRFIHRYHFLQEEIAKLHLDQNAELTGEGVQIREEDYDQNAPNKTAPHSEIDPPQETEDNPGEGESHSNEDEHPVHETSDVDQYGIRMPEVQDEADSSDGRVSRSEGNVPNRGGSGKVTTSDEVASEHTEDSDAIAQTHDETDLDYNEVNDPHDEIAYNHTDLADEHDKQEREITPVPHPEQLEDGEFNDEPKSHESSHGDDHYATHATVPSDVFDPKQDDGKGLDPGPKDLSNDDSPVFTENSVQFNTGNETSKDDNTDIPLQSDVHVIDEQKDLITPLTDPDINDKLKPGETLSLSASVAGEAQHSEPPVIAYDALPELEEEPWDDELDGDGEFDTAWDDYNEHESASNESSPTLSSKTSKRGFDEVGTEEDEHNSPPNSPGSKRARVG